MKNYEEWGEDRLDLELKRLNVLTRLSAIQLCLLIVAIPLFLGILFEGYMWMAWIGLGCVLATLPLMTVVKMLERRWHL